MKECVLIVGVGRSGTSLLQSMLNAHPKITFHPETGFFRKYIVPNLQGSLDNSRITSLKEKLEGDVRFVRSNVDIARLVHEVKNYKELYIKFLKLARKESHSLIGDKDPALLDYLQEVYEVVPFTKIIQIIRDPRDVVLSRTKAEWSKKWPYYLHAYIYVSQLERSRLSARKLFGENYYELYYEDLLSDPERILKGLSTFLNIDYNDIMLEFSESAKALVDERELQWKKETFRPLIKSNVNKWESEFSLFQIYIVQKICGPVFKNHPYKEKVIPLTFAWMMKAIPHIIASRIFRFLYPLRKQLRKW